MTVDRVTKLGLPPDRLAPSENAASYHVATGDPPLGVSGTSCRSPDGGRHRPPTEQEILRVLWASVEHLVRGEILKRLPQKRRPSPGRVGQILSALHIEGLLDRDIGKAQGSSKASYYALSPKGRLECQKLGFANKLRFASLRSISR